MPKFTTPYDTLLRVRRIEEDRAKAKLAAANVAAREAEQALENSRLRYAVVAAGSVAASHGETRIADFLASSAHASAVARGVGYAAQRVESADAARVVEVAATAAASMRTQGLERLVERAKEAREQELLAADQRTAEESMAGARRRSPARPTGPRGGERPVAPVAEQTTVSTAAATQQTTQTTARRAAEQQGEA